MQLEAQLTATYRERAHLVAFLTVLYPSVIILDGDPDAPGWALVYVDSPTGQLSWHLSGDDLDLFPHVKRVETSAVTWDNHTTDEKYGRIRQLTAELAKFPMEPFGVALPDPGPRMDQQCANCPHLRGDHADNIVGNPCLGSYIARPCDCRSFTEPR